MTSNLSLSRSISSLELNGLSVISVSPVLIPQDAVELVLIRRMGSCSMNSWMRFTSMRNCSSWHKKEDVTFLFLMYLHQREVFATRIISHRWYSCVPKPVRGSMYWRRRHGMESLASGLSANGWQRREQGTLEWKNKNVNIETYFDLLTEKKIPSIIKLWPIGEWSNTKFSVTIQQDGAPAHTTKAFGQRFELR